MKAKVVPIDLAGQWADELGDVQAQLAPHRDKIRREEALKKLLAKQADEDGVKPSVGTIYQGERYVAAVSEHEQKRRILSLYKLYRASKAKLSDFFDNCSMTLKDAESVLTSEQRSEHIVSEAAGPRHVKTYARGV